jgi:hypothetical protein
MPSHFMQAMTLPYPFIHNRCYFHWPSKMHYYFISKRHTLCTHLSRIKPSNRVIWKYLKNGVWYSRVDFQSVPTFYYPSNVKRHCWRQFSILDWIVAKPKIRIHIQKMHKTAA